MFVSFVGVCVKTFCAELELCYLHLRLSYLAHQDWFATDYKGIRTNKKEKHTQSAQTEQARNSTVVWLVAPPLPFTASAPCRSGELDAVAEPVVFLIGDWELPFAPFLSGDPQEWQKEPISQRVPQLEQSMCKPTLVCEAPQLRFVCSWLLQFVSFRSSSVLTSNVATSRAQK